VRSSGQVSWSSIYDIPLIMILLVTLLWTSTFLHDFCENVLTGPFESHDRTDHSFLHSPYSADVEQSIGYAEEHSHQPSLFSNYRNDRFGVADDSDQLGTINSLMLPNSWQAGQPMILHSRQRPPPVSVHNYKSPIYLRYQVLLI
jgi:hypothetical protein